jgi:hypothetical protein
LRRLSSSTSRRAAGKKNEGQDSDFAMDAFRKQRSRRVGGDTDSQIQSLVGLQRPSKILSSSSPRGSDVPHVPNVRSTLPL